AFGARPGAGGPGGVRRLAGGQPAAGSHDLPRVAAGLRDAAVQRAVAAALARARRPAAGVGYPRGGWVGPDRRPHPAVRGRHAARGDAPARARDRQRLRAGGAPPPGPAGGGPGEPRPRRRAADENPGTAVSEATPPLRPRDLALLLLASGDV